MKNFFQKRERLYRLAAKPEQPWLFIFFFLLATFLTAGAIGLFLFLDAAKTTEQAVILPKTAEKRTETFNKSGFEQTGDFIGVKKENFEKAKNGQFFSDPSL